jgi:hypothetical protein
VSVTLDPDLLTGNSEESQVSDHEFSEPWEKLHLGADPAMQDTEVRGVLGTVTDFCCSLLFVKTSEVSRT